MDLTGTKLGDYAKAIDALREYSPKAHEALFTLLIRTQGNRSELLQEALCSVMAQTEQDYEVIVLLHVPGVANAPTDSVQRVVDQFPARFQEKVRTIVVHRDGRSAPLNDGIDQAGGKFIGILDDDDLLYDHHFASISQAAADHPSVHVFQTFASRRTLTVLSTQQDATYPYTVTNISPAYAEPFDAGRQLRENFVPSCNFVFSRDLVHALNIRFDEGLDVLEDWKFLMDLHRFSLVVPIPTITTAIGSRSNNTNTVGNPALDETWQSTRTHIQQSLANEARLLSADDARNYASVIEWNNNALDEIARQKARKNLAWRIARKLYYALPAKLRLSRRPIKKTRI